MWQSWVFGLIFCLPSENLVCGPYQTPFLGLAAEGAAHKMSGDTDISGGGRGFRPHVD